MDPSRDKAPYTLVRVDQIDWVVQDRRFRLDDARHVVASAHATEDDAIDVVWIQPIPLPTRYARIDDLLDDLGRWWSMQSGRTTRPIPVPHVPPLTATRP
ncbi:MAG: hypothetical protein ABWY55_01230 [Microbacterium sp.]